MCILLQCKPQPSQREQVYLEVMEIHDEVMPKMGKINRLQRQLKAVDTTNQTLGWKDTILQTITHLESADHGMMDWMAQFKSPLKATPDETAIQYLNKEKKRMIEVKNLMLNSINRGEELLESIDTTKITKQ